MTEEQTTTSSETAVPAGEAEQGQEVGETTFESWFAAQPDGIKGMIEGHIGGLKSAHSRVSEERKALRAELESVRRAKDLDAEQRLQAYEAKLAEAEKRATFLESLPPDCTNRKLAWMAAQEIGAINKAGEADVDRLTREFPELFPKAAVRKAPGLPGAGTNTLPPTGLDFNSALRRAAGRG